MAAAAAAVAPAAVAAACGDCDAVGWRAYDEWTDRSCDRKINVYDGYYMWIVRLQRHSVSFIHQIEHTIV